MILYILIITDNIINNIIGNEILASYSFLGAVDLLFKQLTILYQLVGIIWGCALVWLLNLAQPSSALKQVSLFAASSFSEVFSSKVC